MADNKKRKKSFTVEKKRAEQKKAEQARRKRKNIIIFVSVLLAIAAIVTATALTVNAINDKCAYARTRDIEGRDVVYAEISVKGYGKMTVLLDRTTAPKTVDNFVKLANEGFYDGLTFHRVMTDFMIQGGDPDGDGTGGNIDEDGNKITVKGEFLKNGHKNDIKHIRGTISMARSDAYDSASSQFFICNATNETVSSLDGSYAAFGYVIDGLNVVDKITRRTARYGDANGGIDDVNLHAVIEYVKILDNAD